MRNITLVIVLLLVVSLGSAKNKDAWQLPFITDYHTDLYNQISQVTNAAENDESFTSAVYHSSVILSALQMPVVSVGDTPPNTLTEKEKQQGWKLLFDGKSTKGWKGVDRNEFPAEGWKIVDGTLNSVPNSPDAPVKGVDIITDSKYSAFDFQFEFNYAEGANSGVKYFIGNGGPSIGLEYQIIDDQRHPDAKLGVVGNRCLATLYDLIPVEKQDHIAKPAGEWNTGRIVVYPDNRVEHWLNGKKVLEYVRGSGIYKALVARSKYAGFEGFGMVKETPLLLQYHGDQVRFRSLKIKKL